MNNDHLVAKVGIDTAELAFQRFSEIGAQNGSTTGHLCRVVMVSPASSVWCISMRFMHLLSFVLLAVGNFRISKARC